MLITLKGAINRMFRRNVREYNMISHTLYVC